MLYRGQNKHKTKNNSSWLFNSFMHFCGTLNWIVRHLFKSIFVEPCHPVQLGAWKELHPLHHSSYAIAIELYLKPAVNISLAMSLLQVFLGSCPIRQCCNVHVVLDRQYCHHYISTIDVQVRFILLFIVALARDSGEFAAVVFYWLFCPAEYSVVSNFIDENSQPV